MTIVEGSGQLHAPDTAASSAIRLRALALLRALCQAGSGMAQHLITTGLGSLVMRFILEGIAAEPSQGAQAHINSLMLQARGPRFCSVFA